MGESRDLLFELGSEELPPKSLLKLRDALQQKVVQAMDSAEINYGAIKSYATPRRLALFIRQLAVSQPNRKTKRRGPAVAAAFDNEGKATKAAEGFARSCGTSVEQLTTEKTDKGEWLSFSNEVSGTSTTELIPSIISAALADLPIAKRMRWGTGVTEFVRPVHWSVLIFGNQTITTEILGTRSGNLSFGHRFHAPEPISINCPDTYVELLYDKGKVLCDFDQRRDKIRQQAQIAAESIGGNAIIDPDLLDEITALVEWPAAIVGEFDQRFLRLAPEILISTMQTNQKYFPVTAASGELMPHFITISNIDSSNPDSVRAGNERVIRPRLADAEFFWEQDRKTTLAEKTPALKNIIFHNKLGTLADKSERVQKLAAEIAEELGADTALVTRAAILAKADLVTDMVVEFPNLQGTVGRYYALADHEPEEVANSIEEQYLPKLSGGELPQSQTGSILSLAEKIDTLSGIFAAGLIPSGDKDPYALRRAALGILRIIIEKKLDLDLTSLLNKALNQFPHELFSEMLQTNIADFVKDRYRGYCLDRGYKHDEFDAIVSIDPNHLLDLEMRLDAVRQFRTLPAAESLAAANKRIRNILRKSEADFEHSIDERLFIEVEEIDLMRAAKSAVTDIAPFMSAHDYTAALTRLGEMREPVDLFFDKVMVMSEDLNLRRNRLGLLAKVQALFLQIADISKLQ